MATTRKAGRGGARPGAGMKPYPPGKALSEQIPLKVTPALLRELRRLAHGEDVTVPEYVRAVLARHVRRKRRER